MENNEVFFASKNGKIEIVSKLKVQNVKSNIKSKKVLTFDFCFCINISVGAFACPSVVLAERGCAIRMP